MTAFILLLIAALLSSVPTVQAFQSSSPLSVQAGAELHAPSNRRNGAQGRSCLHFNGRRHMSTRSQPSRFRLGVTQLHSKPTDGITKSISDAGNKNADITGTGRGTSTDSDTIAASTSVFAAVPDRLLGVLVLLTVPLAWGTYGPVVRLLNKIDPPIPGLVFSTSYYTLAAVTTLLLTILESRRNDGNASAGDTADAADERFFEQQQQGQQRTKLLGLDFGTLPINGGLELGTYLFVANCLQIVGLQTVESGRAGFLVQLTTIFVPILEAVLASNFLAVPATTWGACVMAFAGLVVMGLDGQEDMTAAAAATTASATTDITASIGQSDLMQSILAVPSSITSGDLLIIMSAVLYTFHVVRLSKFARNTTPIKLAAVKATWEAILSFVLVGALVMLANSGIELDGIGNFIVDTGKDITKFAATFADGMTSGTIDASTLQTGAVAILWTGWVTCAYTIYAQSFGQSRVGPTDANLIYTFQPIFTALFAYVLVGETMGPFGFIGGGLIGTAVFLIASSSAAAAKTEGGADSQ